MNKSGRPQPNEAESYYSHYIDLVPSDDVVTEMETQMAPTLAFLSGISEEQSLHRYAPDKWSMRELLNHVNDCERLFLFRAFWFARGFQDPLPGFDQNVCVAAAAPDDVSWSNHLDDFRNTRHASLAFFKNLAPQAWQRGGVANDTPFTVRALAYILSGHVTHHTNILKERYL